MSEIDESVQGQITDTTGSSDDAGKDWKVEHDNAQSMIGKQANEIGELRKQLEELKGKVNTPPPDDEDPDKSNKPTDKEDDTSLESIKKIAEDSKLNWEDFEQDYYNNGGKLSDEMRQKAIKAGVSEKFIDKSIESLQKTAKEEYSKVAEAVGGLDELDAVFKWVATDPAKLESTKKLFNTEMSLEAAQYIVQGLKNEMLAKEGKPPAYLKETSGGGVASDVFENQAQVQAYLSDPRADYRSPKYDPAYRQAYREKLSRSIKAGKQIY